MKLVSAQSLVDLCVLYVARNLHLVESLVDFPDQIGKQIFSAARSLGLFECQNEAANMKLFCEAYREQILSSLNLKRNHLVMNDHLEMINLFTHLTELDLTSCGLGDDHPLISSISKIDSLLVLALGDNALTDTGLQRMTSPIRMFHKGPLKLQNVCISDNFKVTIKGVLYFKIFIQLQHFDISRTSVKPSETRRFEEEMGLVQITSTTSDVCFSQIHTKGWAEDVIKHWIQNCENKQKLNSLKPKRPNFYGRPPLALQSKKQLISNTPTSVLILTKHLNCRLIKRDGSSVCGISVNRQKAEEYGLQDVKGTEQNNTECDKKSKYFEKLGKKRKAEDRTGSENENIILMEMYSGTEVRKKSCFSDLC